MKLIFANGETNDDIKLQPSHHHPHHWVAKSRMNQRNIRYERLISREEIDSGKHGNI